MMPINIALYRHKRQMPLLQTASHYCTEAHLPSLNGEESPRDRPVVYLDETWCNAHDGKECDWVERDDVIGRTLGGIKRHPGNGCIAYYSWSLP